MNIAAQRPRLPFREESLKTSKNPCLIKFGKCEPDLGGVGIFASGIPGQTSLAKSATQMFVEQGPAAGDCLSAESLSGTKGWKRKRKRGKGKGTATGSISVNLLLLRCRNTSQDPTLYNRSSPWATSQRLLREQNRPLVEFILHEQSKTR